MLFSAYRLTFNNNKKKRVFLLYNRLQQNFSKTIGVTTKGKISTFYYTK